MTWKTWRIGLLRFRLRSHMWKRLSQGGSPDCPCERCHLDREHFLALAGEPWDDPDRAAYYRDLERSLRLANAARDVAEGRSLTLEEAKERMRKA